MKEDIQADKLLINYLFDVNLVDEIYITLNRARIEINSNNFRHYTIDVVDVENSKYSIVTYKINKSTVISILENGTIVNSQFLIISSEVFNYLRIEDLTKYVNYQIAEIVFEYFSC